MQPYGTDDYQQDKGLFTFYREQADFQKQKKLKSNAENLSKILAKALKQNNSDKKNQKNQTKRERVIFTERLPPKLDEIAEEKSNVVLKRKQIQMKRSIIEVQQDMKSEQQVEQKLSSLQHNQSRKLQIGSSSMNLPNNFSKYQSQIAHIKLCKKEIYTLDTASLSQRLSKPLQKLVNNRKQKYKSSRYKNQTEKSKITVHFKKLALQPVQFEGLIDSSRNFVPISTQKREKTALKSYRKQRLKALVQKRQIQEKNNVSFQQKTIIQDLQEDEKNGKLIRVQRLQNRPVQNLINSQNVLPRIKSKVSQIQTGLKDQKANSMAIMLLKNIELKNKYRTKGLQRQNQSIQGIKERFGNQFRSIKNSPKKINHYISMRYDNSQGNQPGSLINQNQLRSQNSQTRVLRFDQINLRKQKEMFCKRDQYLRNYNKKLKNNIFSLQKEQQSRIKSVIQEKKQELIQNIMENLNLH